MASHNFMGTPIVSLRHSVLLATGSSSGTDEHLWFRVCPCLPADTSLRLASLHSSICATARSVGRRRLDDHRALVRHASLRWGAVCVAVSRSSSTMGETEPARPSFPVWNGVVLCRADSFFL